MKGIETTLSICTKFRSILGKLVFFQANRLQCTDCLQLWIIIGAKMKGIETTLSICTECMMLTHSTLIWDSFREDCPTVRML